MVAARTLFATVTRPGEDEAGPDGMAFDVDGYLYVAVYGSGRVRVVAPDGVLADEIDVGGRFPTNLTFGGPDGSRLFITEAEHGWVVTTEVPRPGLPLWGDPPREHGEGDGRLVEEAGSLHVPFQSVGAAVAGRESFTGIPTARSSCAAQSSSEALLHRANQI
jgi:hypothetical protein